MKKTITLRFRALSPFSHSMVRYSSFLFLSLFILLCSQQFAFAAKDENVNQYMDMDLSELMQVTITSVSKKPQALSDTAAAVFVITQGDIKKSGATTIPDVLSLAPGIHVTQIGSGKWSVSSRGFGGLASNKLLVLIDGRTVYSPIYSGTFWDMQNTLLEDVERIEVIRGPGGTIWGANAVNGVINIITKNSEETKGGLIRAGVGSHEHYTGAARFGGKINDTTSGRVYMTATDRGSFQLDADGTDSKDDWDTYQIGFRLDGLPDTTSSWSLHGDAFKNDGEELLYPYWYPGPPYLGTEEVDIESEGANLTGRFEKELAEGRKLTIQTYYDYSARDEDRLVFSYHTVDLDLQYDHRLNDIHTFTLGSGYRFIDGSFDDTFQYSGPDDSYNLFTGFIQDEVTLVENMLSTTVGLKWEHNDFSGNEWQPSASLLYKPIDAHSLWFSVARAVRTPSVLEDGGELVFATYPSETGTEQVMVVGNSDFDSEIVYTYEAGYRYHPGQIFSTDFTVFYSDYSDLYSFLSTDGGQAQTFDNVLDAESYGFEASVKYRPVKTLEFDLAYSWLTFEFSEETSENSIIAKIIESTVPEHQVSLHGSWAMLPTLQVNVWLKYQSDTNMYDAGSFFTSEIDIDAFFALDLGLIWQVKDNLEVSLVGQNLLDESRLQYVSESLSPAIEIEREVLLKCTYSF